jgi:hypothetical protein
MTGLICELSQECPNREPPNRMPIAVPAKATEQEAVKAADSDSHQSREGSLNWKNTVQPLEPVDEYERRADSSPLKRLKRSRASISATATAEVMAARAAKQLSGTFPTRSPGQGIDGVSSESSDSTEEEDESLAIRVRRAQAFECGAMSANGPTSPVPPPSPGHPPGELSPRSKLAFERGMRAAQVAAKVAASMLPDQTREKHRGGA